MSGTANLRLSPYYLNTRRLRVLSAVDLPIAAQHSLVNNSDERVNGMRAAERVANQTLQTDRIPLLLRAIDGRDPTGERILACHWDVYTFKGLSTALQREQEGKPFTPATFTGGFAFGDGEISLKGSLYNEHVFSSSSTNVLARRRRLMIAGMFDFQGTSVEVEPYIIGELIEPIGHDFYQGYAQSVRVYPVEIDAFSKVADQPRPSAAEIRIVAQMHEEDVKRAIAEIIGEAYLPKDWGGEKSDLTTNRLSIRGKPTSAAFILKGRSVQGELYPSRMGKRGDQLNRVFEEPSELIVVQHVHKISNYVVRNAEALAYSAKFPKRYCIIDGQETARILKAYGKFPASE